MCSGLVTEDNRHVSAESPSNKQRPTFFLSTDNDAVLGAIRFCVVFMFLKIYFSPIFNELPVKVIIGQFAVSHSHGEEFVNFHGKEQSALRNTCENRKTSEV